MSLLASSYNIPVKSKDFIDYNFNFLSWIVVIALVIITSNLLVFGGFQVAIYLLAFSVYVALTTRATKNFMNQ